jgi:hypothetical protein
MFKSLRNALGLGGAEDIKSSTPTSQRPAAKPRVSDNVSEWASTHGFALSARPDGHRGYQVEGKVAGKDWRIELGKPSRDFIKGTELRARADLGVRDDVVMIMSRSLKDQLEKRAFESYTDALQTIADPLLPEEMRWISVYEEVGWEALSDSFLNNYAVLSDDRSSAMAWVSQELVDLLLAWPLFDPSTPKILMLLRGKVYLRMQISEHDLPTIEHATKVFTTTCELVLSALLPKSAVTPRA